MATSLREAKNILRDAHDELSAARIELMAVLFDMTRDRCTICAGRRLPSGEVLHASDCFVPRLEMVQMRLELVI